MLTSLLVKTLRVIDGLKPGDHEYATASQMFGGTQASCTYGYQLEHAFFRAVRLRNGTYKTTRPGRLNDLNELLGRHLPQRRPLRIKDVAISSGVSTAEWSEQLCADGIDHELTATDLTVNAVLVSFTDRLGVLFDEEGGVLQVDIAGYPVYPRLSGRLNKQLLGLPSRLAGWVMGTELAAFIGKASDQGGTGLVRRLELVTPRLRELGIDVEEEDLLHPNVPEPRWDVIRAANILNRSYFGEDELRHMLRGLLASVEVGGLLAICRTDSDALNHGSIWRLHPDGGIELVGRVGNGSEVDDLLAGCAADLGREHLDGGRDPGERGYGTSALHKEADGASRRATYRAP